MSELGKRRRIAHACSRSRSSRPAGHHAGGPGTRATARHGRAADAWAIASGSHIRRCRPHSLSASRLCLARDRRDRAARARTGARQRQHGSASRGAKHALAPSQALAFWPAHRSWLGTENGVDVAMSSADAESSANPTAPGPWAAAGAGPAGTVVAFFQSADPSSGRPPTTRAKGSSGARTTAHAWQEVLNGLPEIHCLAGRGNQLLIGLATGVTALELPFTWRHAVAGSGDARGSGRARARTRCGGAMVGRDERWCRAGRKRSHADDGRAGRTSGHGDAVSTPRSSDVDGSVFFGGEPRRVSVPGDAGPVVSLWRRGGRRSELRTGSPSIRIATSFPAPTRCSCPWARSLRRGPDAAVVARDDNGIARRILRTRASPHVRDTARGVPGSHPRAGTRDCRRRARPVVVRDRCRTDRALDGADWWQRRETEPCASQRTPTVRSVARTQRRRADVLAVRAQRQSVAVADAVRHGFRDQRSAGIGHRGTAGPCRDVDRWREPLNSVASTAPRSRRRRMHPQPLACISKPDAVRILDGAFRHCPGLLAASDWRYLSIEPEVVPQPLAFPAWTIEGRMLPEPHRGRGAARGALSRGPRAGTAGQGVRLQPRGAGVDALVAS